MESSNEQFSSYWNQFFISVKMCFCGSDAAANQRPSNNTAIGYK